MKRIDFIKSKLPAENPCGNCCTSFVLWSKWGGCMNKCRDYRQYLRDVNKHYREYGELPSINWTHTVVWREP